jgi:hypothetical protein
VRIRPLQPLARLAAALLGAALAACHFGRNVSDDCWIDRDAHEAAQRFRAGLRARNLPPGDPAWALADARIEQSRRALRACEDGAAAMGRPDVAELSHGEGQAPAPGSELGSEGTAPGGHGA